MLVEGDYRPGGEQFAEESGSDQAFSLDTPFDLEGNIRAFIEQERASYQQAKARFEEASGGREPDFNAALWMHRKLSAMSREQTDQEAGNFMYDLKTAWDVVAFSLYDDDSQDTVKTELSIYAEAYDRNSVTL